MEKKRNKTVLIIDDEVDCCMLLGQFFKKKDCDVFIAYTLSEGITMLDDHAPDIVFLDNNLPDGLGWLYAAQILERFPDTALYLISAYNNDHLQLQPKELFSVVEKPISMAKLETFI